VEQKRIVPLLTHAVEELCISQEVVIAVE
jgi:hypothetical protein